MATVRLVGVTKKYPKSSYPAVAELDLTIADGEFFVLLGPSGCGKSTLLKIIAGLEEPTSGEVYIGNDLVNYRPPGRRNVAMVFQEYALYPHMTVRKNIAFPLRMHKIPKSEIWAAVESAAETLELTPLLDRYIDQLSGGQRQRVALARAIVRRPAVMLLDEPLSNLDAVLRLQTRDEVMSLHRTIQTTMIYVTHDQIEAMTMGHRIAVLKDGEIIQVGTPREVYDLPEDRFVAGFIGSPRMNFVSGHLVGSGGEVVFRGDALEVPVPAAIAQAASGVQGRDDVTLGVRPGAINVVTHGSQSNGRDWRVGVVEDMGSQQLIELQSGEERLRATIDTGVPISEGAFVQLTVDSTRIHLFDGNGKNVVTKPSSRKSFH